MNQKQTIIWAVITAGAIMILGIFLFQRFFLKEENEEIEIPQINFSEIDIQETPQFETDLSLDTSPIYRHQNPNFSFRYPSGFSVGVFPEGEGEIVLVQRPEENVGVQIFIQEWATGEPITVDLIRRDLPNVPIADPRPIEIDGRQTGVAFVSKSGDLIVREVWFVSGNYSFQITASASFDSALTQMLGTWEVN